MGLLKLIDFQSDELGPGMVRYAWHPSRTLVAIAGGKGKIYIVNQENSDVIHQFSVSGLIDLKWDPASDYLAAISEKTGTVTLYRNKNRSIDTFDSGVKDLTFVRWSNSGSHLAIGSKNGTLVLYSRSKAKKLPIVGTHSQAILDAAWSVTKNRLVMIGADRLLTVSESDGTVLTSAKLAGDPLGLTLMEVPGADGAVAGCYVAVNIGKSMQVVDILGNGAFNAQFKEEFGTITALSTGVLPTFVIGFSTGTIGLATLANNEVKMLVHCRGFQGPVLSIGFSRRNGMVSAVGDNALRFFAKRGDVLADLRELEVVMENGSGQMGTVAWSAGWMDCGLSMNNGSFYSFSLEVADLSASCGNLVFTFISVRLVGVKDIAEDKILSTIAVDVEPTFMAAGMGTLAVGAGNKVHYYEFFIPNTMQAPLPETPTPEGEAPPAPPTEPFSKLIRKVEYPSAVKGLKVTSRMAAVNLDGRVQVHSIRDAEAPPTLFPPQGSETKVAAFGISEPLFLYATTTKVCILALQNMQTVVEYTCRTGLKHAFPNPSCTRVAYVDDKNSLFLLNPITEVASHAEGYEEDCKTILWDQGDPTVFVAHNGSQFTTFVCAPHSRHGVICESILAQGPNKDSNLYTPMPENFKPISLFRGKVFCQASSGMVDSIPLETHKEIEVRKPNPTAFYHNFSLNRLRWCSQNISTPQEADDLAVKSLHLLDIELAIRVYRQLSQPGLVLCLEKIKHIHEKNLLIGHISMIMGYFKDAQNFFLHSSQPLRALEMRRDLMQWEPALTLAKDLAPEKVPIISKEFAQQLEYRGTYTKALDMYKNGKSPLPSGHASTELTAAVKAVEEHNEECLQGTARCYLRTGSIKEGMEIALQSNDTAFALDCAKLCEENRRYDEAAQLFEKGGDVDRAVSLYIDRCRNLKAASRLLPQIESRNIIGMFASAKEAEGDFVEAEKAYRQAEDYDNVVRLKVEKLNDLTGAHEIVRKTRSSDAAALVAKMCQQRGDIGSAVEFLVLAKASHEAFDLAKKNNCMFNYQQALLNQVVLKDGIAPLQSQKDFALVGEHYDKEGKPGQAALFYHIAGNFPQALKKYMEGGEPEDIEKAIEVVGRAHSDALTSKLIDYLMGDTDGQPKEPSYIFKLYMALGSFEKAAKISVFIASKKQDEGQYRTAHKTLVDACSILRERNLRVPNDLRRSLMLLHSYIIVKDLIKLKDDGTATRMLLRVSRNIQKFPAHIAAILTSAVLQCVKTNFKKSAFELACSLIQNEKYRTELSDKNRKKIEGIVRRRGKEDMEDPVESTSPCPFCDAPVPETELDCGACKNTLLFCITTGKHIVKSDYAMTPCCGFPTIYSAMMARLKEIPSCPICEAMLDVNKVQRSSEQDFKSLQ